MQASLSDYQLCFVFQLKGRWAGVGLELEEHEWMGGGIEQWACISIDLPYFVFSMKLGALQQNASLVYVRNQCLTELLSSELLRTSKNRQNIESYKMGFSRIYSLEED